MKSWTPKEIEEFRKRQGLTQKEFGELTGVAMNTVWRWESGLIIPPMTVKILLGLLEEGFSKKKSTGRKGGGKRHGKRTV